MRWGCYRLILRAASRLNEKSFARRAGASWTGHKLIWLNRFGVSLQAVSALEAGRHAPWRVEVILRAQGADQILSYLVV